MFCPSVVHGIYLCRLPSRSRTLPHCRSLLPHSPGALTPRTQPGVAGHLGGPCLVDPCPSSPSSSPLNLISSRTINNSVAAIQDWRRYTLADQPPVAIGIIPT
ncbi:hypothetical protein E2C01_078478 [Portunus trituberculatus]|uniref:Uncharacterized protein n=1 Tax=Portunus trituberculatus TaxID=210409 RepID=A0A5B7IIW2_PORTR|nr:hypothetical protein [Portunus trituberculatus]